MNLNPIVSQRAEQDLEGVRTHKLNLEAKLKTTLRNGHPCIAWMVENVADLINKFKIGQDGRTANERLKGKTYKGVIHEFVSLSPPYPRKTSRRIDAGKMGARSVAWEKIYHRRARDWS